MIVIIGIPCKGQQLANDSKDLQNMYNPKDQLDIEIEERRKLMLRMFQQRYVAEKKRGCKMEYIGLNEFT